MLRSLSRLLRTFTFKLGLVYVGLFSLSVVLLFGVIYTFAVNIMEAQTAEAVRLQYAHLLNEYKENGSAGVENRIQDMIASDDEGSEIYLLVNREGERLAGNMSAWPQYAVKDADFEREGDWITFRIEGTRSHPSPIEVKAVSVPLSKWRSLLVGKSLQNKNKVEQTIVQTFWASLLVTLIMAFIGASIMTWSVMRRLAVINRSAETIMQGELSARIPHNDSGDEFDDLSANLNRMLDKIQMLLRSLSDFANNIAHDLRSPLTRIISRTDAGMRDIEEQHPSRALLERNISDMEELVATFNAILRISELEASAGFRNFEDCDLQPIIEKLTDYYEPLAHERGIRLVNGVQAPVVVQGEKHMLTQAFANLIDNAVKFTHAGGAVSIEAEQQDGVVVITVSDNGPGVPEAYHDKVFEKFFRLEFSRNTKGNGLGLSLVAAIARIHKAVITLADNAPGLKVRIQFVKDVDRGS